MDLFTSAYSPGNKSKSSKSNNTSTRNSDNIYDSNNYRKNRNYLNKIAQDNYTKAYDPNNPFVIPKFYNQYKESKNRNDKRIENIKNTDGNVIKNNVIEDFSTMSSDSKFSDSNFTDDESHSVSDAGNPSFSKYPLKSRKRKDIHSEHLNLNDPMSFYSRSNQFKNNKFFEDKVSENRKSTYLSQFDDLKFDNASDPVSRNNSNKTSGSDPSSKILRKIEMDRDLAMKGGFSNLEDSYFNYDVVDKKDFVHNNMVPFFSINAKNGYGHDMGKEYKLSEVKQRKVDTFTGSINNVEYKPKTERKPLFNPIVGNSWIYGMPNFTDYLESRHIPGKERRNEFLQQPSRITPGLNLGYNEISTQGFHDTYRVLPPSVDELRTANNPKIEYPALINHGQKGTRRPIQTSVPKRRPETFWEKDTRDLQKTRSYYTAPTVHGDHNAKDTNRNQTTKEWFAHAKHGEGGHYSRNLKEGFEESHRENYLQSAPTNITAVGHQKLTTNTKNSYNATPTNRMYNGKKSYVNPALSQYKQGNSFNKRNGTPQMTNRDINGKINYINPALSQYKQSYSFDKQNGAPEVTNRDINGKMNYINPALSQYKQSYSFDRQNGTPQITHRDINGKMNYVNPALSQDKRGYSFNHKNGVPLTTNRNIHGNLTYVGNATSEYKQSYAFDKQSNTPMITNRDIYGNTTYVGNATPGYKSSYAFDKKSATPCITQRDIHNNNTYVGPAAPDYKQSYFIDKKNATPNATQRDIHGNLTYVGQANPNYKQTYAFDKENGAPKVTHRDIHGNSTIIGHANPNYKQTYAYDKQNGTPQVTQRDIHGNSTRIGHASSNYKQTYAYDKQNGTPQVTQRDIHGNSTRIGHASSNYKQTYAYDKQNGIPQVTQRDIHGNSTRIGHASSNYKQTYAFDKQNGTPQVTQRDIHGDQRYIGHAAPNYKRTYTFDKQNGTPQVTQRDIHGSQTHINPAGSEQNKSYVYNKSAENIPNQTNRTIYENKTYVNPAGTQFEKSYAFNKSSENQLEPTNRTMHENKVYINPALAEFKKSYGFNKSSENVPDPTNRNIHENNTHINPAGHHEGEKQRNRTDANNSLVNLSKDSMTVIRDNGAPTTSNYEKTPTYEHTMYELCEPTQVNRELYPNMSGKNVNDCMPTMETRLPSLYKQTDERINSCVLESLNKNPFINNTQHKSAEYDPSYENTNLDNYKNVNNDPIMGTKISNL